MTRHQGVTAHYFIKKGEGFQAISGGQGAPVAISSGPARGSPVLRFGPPEHANRACQGKREEEAMVLFIVLSLLIMAFTIRLSTTYQAK